MTGNLYDCLDDEFIAERLKAEEIQREQEIVPYLERMGNCEFVLLGGHHAIYEQKPDEVGKIIEKFMNELE